MRLRLVLLVGATTSLVLVAFLVPLAMLVRTSASDRAVSAAVVEVQALAPTVATVDVQTLRLTVSQMNAAGPHKITVFLPDGSLVGAPAQRSASVRRAATGTSITADTPDGREVLVAVAGLPGGTAVIRTLVPGEELYRGVTRAWLVLGGLGLGLLAVSLLVADLLARSLVRPLAAVATVSHRLARGDLAARAVADGPPEVREVASGLNLLAGRIVELLTRERETVADLSHRLRTPLTALRIDAESLRDPADQSRMMADADELERAVDDVIRAARRPVAGSTRPASDASYVVAERVAFWSALAEEEQRAVSVELPDVPVPVGVSADDLTALVDALLGNVFAHTPEGTALSVTLTGTTRGGGQLVVADDGPGMTDAPVLRRGSSGAGSTGLGLDIARRTARDSGGGLTLRDEPGRGAVVVVDLGPPRSVEESAERGRVP
jgi:signal transduction histidine kinase